MRIPRPLTIRALLGLLLGGLLVAAPRPAAAQGAACFQETGFCVRGRFLDYWTANGGLARNGFPLTEERQELLEDGNTYTVQYFERVRLELHPENAAPYDVLLGQFGRRILRSGDESTGQPDPAAAAPASPIADAAYFPETGHNLGGAFRDYWQANGGLAQFGYPLSEEFEQELPVGFAPRARYRVQYFERARLEYHPENADPQYQVLLGQFGRRILVENDQLAAAPGVKLLYTASERVQGLLGPPTADPLAQAPGAYQGFERGLMLYRGDVRGIYVLCGGEQAGRLIPGGGSRPTLFFPDTSDPGQPVGGGPGPQPGLYEPQRGFGKLWQENQIVHDCLGYATTPDETPYTIAAKGFARGQLLSATTPTRQFIYAVYGTLPNPGGPLYERYPNPVP